MKEENIGKILNFASILLLCAIFILSSFSLESVEAKALRERDKGQLQRESVEPSQISFQSVETPQTSLENVETQVLFESVDAQTSLESVATQASIESGESQASLEGGNAQDSAEDVMAQASLGFFEAQTSLEPVEAPALLESSAEQVLLESAQASQEDPIARELLNIILSRQPEPYGLPGSSFHYHWAQFMMTVLAAEQNGYIGRTEAIDRISGILSVVTQLEKYYGFVYDSYDFNTLQPTTTGVNFQGWYLYSLIVIKNTYPELAGACQSLLDGIDYYNSGMYNQSEKALAQTYYAGEGPSFYWYLTDSAASEIRIGYLAYAYITGDKTPWLLNEEPLLQTVEGHDFLKVWHNFNFDPVLLHNQMLEYGYYEKSWDELIIATQEYMNTNGMVLFPIREEPLHFWPGIPFWPNTEHRESMSWLTWYFDFDAPVMAKAFITDYGISRYYDNWNFYWTYGSNPTLHPRKIGTTGDTTDGYFIFPFFVYPPDDALNPTNPPELKSISFMAGYDAGKMPNGNLIIELNGNEIGQVGPFELSTLPTPVEITGINAPLFRGGNYITFKNADLTTDYTYNLYQYENYYRFVKYRYPDTNNVIASLDTLDDLEQGQDNHAQVSMYAPTGYTGNALGINYDFSRGGNWVQISKDCSDIDISNGSAIQFYYRAAGDQADLEVKLEDIDGTTYGYRFYNIDYTLLWTPLSIPYVNFYYYWGGKDNILDTEHIKNIWFTIIKTSENSSGTFNIDDVTIDGNIGVTTELIPPAIMEVIVDGQREGEENSMAFLSRVAVAHNYYVHENLLSDTAFIDSLVGWIGGYYNQMSLAPYVHNVGSSTIEVSYDRPDTWTSDSLIQITDITDNIDVTDTAIFQPETIYWPALSTHTYKIEYLSGGIISGRVTLQSRTDHSKSITFELRNPGETIPINTYQIITASDGSYTLNDIRPGTYDLTAKASNFLRAKQSDVIVVAEGEIPNIDFSLLGGDCDGNNIVSLMDFAILRAAYGSSIGDPLWNEEADFNGNGQIDLTDFSVLRSNYGVSGEE